MATYIQSIRAMSLEFLQEYMNNAQVRADHDRRAMFDQQPENSYIQPLQTMTPLFLHHYVTDPRFRERHAMLAAHDNREIPAFMKEFREIITGALEATPPAKSIEVNIHNVLSQRQLRLARIEAEKDPAIRDITDRFVEDRKWIVWFDTDDFQMEAAPAMMGSHRKGDAPTPVVGETDASEEKVSETSIDGENVVAWLIESTSISTEDEEESAKEELSETPRISVLPRPHSLPTLPVVPKPIPKPIPKPVSASVSKERTSPHWGKKPKTTEGTGAVIQFLRNQFASEKKEEHHDVSLIMLGNAGVGKTSFINRLIKAVAQFNDLLDAMHQIDRVAGVVTDEELRSLPAYISFTASTSTHPQLGTATPELVIEEPRSTIGLDYRRVSVRVHNGKTPVVLQLWDTAGNERFRALTSTYVRNAAIAIYMMSFVDHASMVDIKNVWIPFVDKHRNPDESHFPIFIINKDDKPVDARMFTCEEAARRISGTQHQYSVVPFSALYDTRSSYEVLRLLTRFVEAALEIPDIAEATLVSPTSKKEYSQSVETARNYRRSSSRAQVFDGDGKPRNVQVSEHRAPSLRVRGARSAHSVRDDDTCAC